MNFLNHIRYIIGLFLVIINSQNAQGEEIITSELQTADEIRTWASDCSAGCELQEFERYGERVIVVITHHTSGFASSGALIYQHGFANEVDYLEDNDPVEDKYKLVASREWVYGIARIEEDAQEVSIYVDGASILSLSWMSLKLPPNTK